MQLLNVIMKHKIQHLPLEIPRSLLIFAMACFVKSLLSMDPMLPNIHTAHGSIEPENDIS